MTLRRRLLVAAAVLGLVAGGCGITVDDSPRALRLDQTTTTASATPSTGRFGALLYYVAAGELLPTVQELPDRSISTIITELLRAPTGAPASHGLGTSIPAGTELLGFTRDRDRLVIDLSESFDNVVGQARQQAIGQLTLTTTELAGIDVVQFRVEGRPVRVSSPERGDADEVGACDFAPLLAGLDDAVDTGLSIVAIEELNERHEQLAEECPDSP